MHTDTPFPMKATTGKKWKRLRSGLMWTVEVAEMSAETDTARVRQIAGLGVNVTKIYPEGRPYLRGFFNALEAWRGWRDVDGWRLQKAEDELALLSAEEASDEGYQADYPDKIRITDELKLHVRGLLELFDSEEPLLVAVRPTDAGKIRYHVGDASAEGFAALTHHLPMRIAGKSLDWGGVMPRSSNLERQAAPGGTGSADMSNILDRLKKKW